MCLSSTWAQQPGLIWLKTGQGGQDSFHHLADDSIFVWINAHGVGSELDLSLREDESVVVEPEYPLSVIVYDDDLAYISHFSLQNNSGMLTPLGVVDGQLVIRGMDSGGWTGSPFNSDPPATDVSPQSSIGYRVLMLFDMDDEVRLAFVCDASGGAQSADSAAFHAPSVGASTHFQTETYRSGALSSLQDDGRIVSTFDIYEGFVLDSIEEYDLPASHFWGALRVITDLDSQESEHVLLTSGTGTAITRAVAPSADGQSVYRSGMVIGDQVPLSPEGAIWSVSPDDTLTHTFLLKETTQGELQWSRRLFSFGNSADDSLQNQWYANWMVDQTIIEKGNDVYLSRSFTISAPIGDTLQMVDIYGERSDVAAPEGFESFLGQFVGHGGQTIYHFDTSGALIKLLTLPRTEADLVHWSNFGADQFPHLFDLGSVFAWPYSYSAQSDTIVQLVYADGQGTETILPVDLPAGQGVCVFLLDNDLMLLDSFILPSSTTSTSSNGINVMHIGRYGESELIISGVLSAFAQTTTSLDPTGVAPEVVYDQRSTFVARYGLPEVLVGLSDVSLPHEQWSVYPNPTVDELRIDGKGDESIDRVEVYGLSGSLLMVDRLTTPRSAHRLSLDLPAGSYTLRLIRDEAVIFSTVIIKE